MPEATSIYTPGQKKLDAWTIYPMVDSYFVTFEDPTPIQVAFDGTEQRFVGPWPSEGRPHFSWATMPLDREKEQEFRDFLVSLRGAGNPFYFFQFDEEYFFRQSLGASDGTANHQMPFKGCTTPTEVRNRTTSTALTGFGFTANFGTGGEDRLTGLTTPATPSAGHILEATFYGKRRWIVRQEAGQVARQFFAGGRTQRPLAQWQMSLVAVI